MSFDPQQWLAAVDAYHRGQRDGAQQAPAPGSIPAEGKDRHCFGCGETYLAYPRVWEQFPDPANPYALCSACTSAHDRSTSAVTFHVLERRQIFRVIRDNRQELARKLARHN